MLLIGYFGSGDASLSMRCSPSERKAMGLLKKVLPEWRNVVGHRCAMMLEQGDKLELEAAVSSSLRKAAAA